MNKIRDSSVLAIAGMWILALCAWLLISAQAFAGYAHIQFQRPTTFEDGTPLAESQIIGYDVRCSFFSIYGTGYSAPCAFPDTRVTSTQVLISFDPPGVVGGSACFQVRAVTADGRMSDWTAEFVGDDWWNDNCAFFWNYNY